MTTLQKFLFQLYKYNGERISFGRVSATSKAVQSYLLLQKENKLMRSCAFLKDFEKISNIRFQDCPTPLNKDVIGTLKYDQLSFAWLIRYDVNFQKYFNPIELLLLRDMFKDLKLDDFRDPKSKDYFYKFNAIMLNKLLINENDVEFKYGDGLLKKIIKDIV